MNKAILLVALPLAAAFVVPSQFTAPVGKMERWTIHRLQQTQDSEQQSFVEHKFDHQIQTTGTKSLSQWLGAATLGATLLFAAPVSFTAMAYDPSDYASETVQTTIKALQDSAGNADETYKVFEVMNEIITEGKGVGGAINYKGVQLERGYVADEDTTIYNPGLTLLTESEKERLVEAIVTNRKAALESGDWSEKNQLAFAFLREKLDPFHVAELRGYLQILPFYAAVVYVAVLAVQQFVRDLFPAAYIVGVVAIFAPALVLVALGPS